MAQVYRNRRCAVAMLDGGGWWGRLAGTAGGGTGAGRADRGHPVRLFHPYLHDEAGRTVYHSVR